MKYKILAIKWRSARHTVGFVAYDTGFEGQWNSVVGFVPPTPLELMGILPPPAKVSEQYIAANGAKLEWQVAEILFPDLPIEKHKYYNGPIR